LRPEFIAFFLRPVMTQIADFDMQLAESLIDVQILDIHIRFIRAHRLYSEIESIGFSTPQLPRWRGAVFRGSEFGVQGCRRVLHLILASPEL